MRFLIALSLVCMVASRSVEEPSELIDYGQCYWDWGSEGQDVTCEAGWIGIGACGSETMENCNSRSTGLRCCLMKNGATQNDCLWVNGDKGQTIECTAARCVHGYCGSGGSDKCGSTFKVQCCNSDVQVIKDGNCGWTYGCNGCQVECGNGKVLAGLCGSRNLNQCPGNTHGIYCCNITERK